MIVIGSKGRAIKQVGIEARKTQKSFLIKKFILNCLLKSIKTGGQTIYNCNVLAILHLKRSNFVIIVNII